MFWNLFRKDVLLQILSSRFLFAFLVAALLMVGSTWVLLRDYEDRFQAYAAFAAEHQRQVGSYETGAHDLLGALSMGGRILDRRPPALSFLFTGVDRELPKSFWISNYDGPVPETNLVENRLDDLFELVDFRFSTGVIFSLLALLFSYDAINGERQSGTLRLMFANPLGIRTFLAAKWASLTAVLGVAFVLAFLLSLLLAFTSPLLSFGGDEMLRILLITLVVLLYFAVFVTLGLLCSSLFAEPYSAIAVALLAWTTMVFILPGAAPYVALLGEETPSYVTTAASRQDDLGYSYRAIVRQHVEQGFDQEEAQRRTEEYWREEVEPRLAEHNLRQNEEFLNRKAGVIARGRTLARLSPYGGFSFAVTELAGTGVAAQQDFERAVETYRREFKEFIRRQEELGRQDEVQFSEIPSFSYASGDLGSVLPRVMVDVAVLAGLALLLFGFTYVRMLRYDVR